MSCENIYASNGTCRRAAAARRNAASKSAQLELNRRALLFQAVFSDYMRSNPATEQEIFNFLRGANRSSNAASGIQGAPHSCGVHKAKLLKLIEQLQGGAAISRGIASEGTFDWTDLGVQVVTLAGLPPSRWSSRFQWRSHNLRTAHIQLSQCRLSLAGTSSLREDSRASVPPPLDSVRDLIKQQVEQQKFQDYMESVRNSSAE